MATLGDIVINLRMNHRSVTTGAKASRGQLRGLGTTANTTTASISRLSTAVGGLATLAAGLTVKFGIGLAAEAETARVGFEVLLGSASKARETLADLEQFAASTPFELAGLRDASKTLIAFGTEQREVISDLRMLGDVSALSGKNLGELASLYGKARINQRLFADDVTRFAETGIPIIAELEEKFGVTGAALRKMVEQGGASFQDLENALQRATSEGGKFFNGMAKQSKTLSGVYSTLKDNAKAVLRGLGEELVDALDLKGRASSLIEFVSSLRAPIVELVRGIRQFVAEHPRLFRLAGGFLAILVAAKTATLIIGGMKALLMALSFNPVILGLTAVATLFVELFGTGDSFLAKMQDIFGKIAAGFNELGRNYDALQNKYLQFISGVDDAKVSDLKVQTPDISPFVQQLKEALETAKGFESVMGGLKAGQQTRGTVIAAVQQITPDIETDQLNDMLRDFERGKTSVDELSESLAAMSEEFKGFKPVSFDLSGVEKIGNAAAQAAERIRVVEARIIALRDANKAGELSQQEYSTALAASREAYDKVTGGAEAYLATLRKEIELVGKTADERKLYELVQAKANGSVINSVAAAQKELAAKQQVVEVAKQQEELAKQAQQQKQDNKLQRELAIRNELLESQRKLAESIHGMEAVRLAELFSVEAKLQIDPAKVAELQQLTDLDQFDIASKLGLGVNEAEKFLAIINNNRAVKEQTEKPDDSPTAKSSSAALVGSGEVYSRILAASKREQDPALKQAKKQLAATKQVVTAVEGVKTAIEDNEGVLIA
jgi:tape measure domain-containing protein